MSAISNFLNQIKTAIYGEEVRGAIHDAIEQCYTDVANAKTLADQSTTSANNAAASANSAATKANNAASSANSAAQSATTAANTANAAANNASNAKEAANSAAQVATSAANQANDAAASVNTAKTNAETAAQAANTAAEAANAAATDATDAANAANAAKDDANALLFTHGVVENTSGSIASFSDGADDMPVKKLEVNIEPVQDLHGYDHPWPGGGGVNLFDEDNPNIINAYIDSGAIVGSSSHRMVYIPCLPNTTYSFSKVAIVTGDRLYGGWTTELPSNGVMVYDATGRMTNFVVGNRYSFTVTTGDNAAYLAIWCARDSDEFSASLSTIQIEVGDATPYAPYSNICPIEGWTGVKVSRAGKNLYNKNSQGITRGMYLNYKTGKLTSSGTGFDASDYIAVEPGVSYVLSGHPDGLLEFCYYDVNKKFVHGTTTKSRVFTPPDNTAYVRFDYKRNYLDTIQLELGSVETDYEPYSGDTYEVTFPSESGTVYGGTLDVVSGVLTVNKGIVDLGTRNWEYTASYFYSSMRDLGAKNTEINTVILDNICSQYRTNSYVGWADFDVTYFQNACRIRDSRYTDKDSFKSAMSGVMYVFELENPITYQLTPTEVKTLLGENNIWADAGDVNVDYIADTKLYIDKKFTELQALVLENVGG